jgi:hypothetical protein
MCACSFAVLLLCAAFLGRRYCSKDTVSQPHL